jgi:hypothetical protein
MLALPKERELLTHWQDACALLLAQVDVADFSHQVQVALFLDHKLERADA